MDIEKFLTDYKVMYMTGGKNWQPGWVQITCPLCGDVGFHGGFNVAGKYYNCWKCGHQPLTLMVMKLAKIKSYTEAKKIIREYSVGFVAENKRKIAKAVECELPAGWKHMDARHRMYLSLRGYDPNDMQKHWGLLGTGPTGNYKFRIIAPVIVDGIMISYQGRDYTGRQELRYKACEIDNEVTHHKHVVYGIDYVKERCIIVEGITDVWRLGPGAVAMFGTAWTQEQLLFLKKRVKGGVVLFDSDSTAKGEMLTAELIALGLDFQQLIMASDYTDPGSLSDERAAQVMKTVRSDVK
jgi:hypothetical protein